ncbi:MAG TPA: hypothetical protein VFQ52_07795, partial [Rhizomicrobium sp.]|nr:hypothetical protein [Rhizomicrobium sp.]
MEHDDYQRTLGDLPQWYELSAVCSTCQRAANIDRYEMARRFGGGKKMSALAGRLVCQACGNRLGNMLLIGMMPRD